MKSILASLLLLVSISSFAPIPEIESQHGNRFAFSMLKTLSKGKKDNFVFSPYGLRNCFAYVYAGAQKTTKQQIQQAFLFESDPEKELKTFQLSNSSFESCTEKVKIANSMWIRSDAASIKQSYLDLTKKYTDAVKPLQGASQVNNWVSKKTDGEIKELVTDGEMSNIKLLLLNTLLLDAQWQSPFEKRNTFNLPFFTGKETISVPTMTGVVQGHYFEDASMKLVQLPYTGSLSMTIIMPENDNYELNLDDKMQKRLKGDMDLYGDLKLWKEHKFLLELPKFKQATTLDLIPSLLDMGVTDAFSEGEADFSNMNSLLYLGLVKQKAVVEVMETGTKAAAATAVGFLERGGPPPTYSINKPFYFIIHHHQTGEILFMGKIVEPK